MGSRMESKNHTVSVLGVTVLVEDGKPVEITSLCDGTNMSFNARLWKFRLATEKHYNTPLLAIV